MGSGHSAATDRLPYRMRYNDSSLTELGLTTPMSDEEELDAVIRNLPRNHTIRSVVVFDAFSSHVLQSRKWWDLCRALVSVPSLQQVELLETSVPLDTLRILLQTSTLETLAVTDGIQLGSITPKSIRQLRATILEQQQSGLQLREFVWECDFHHIMQQYHKDDESFVLDPLLTALAGLPKLELLGLVNSHLHEQQQVAGEINLPFVLLSPHAIFQFCRQRRLCLHTLDFSGCGLQDEHFRMLRRAFTPSQQQLHQCDLPPQHATAATDDQSSTTAINALTKLHVQRNPAATETGWNELVRLLESNQTIRLQTLVSDASAGMQEQIQFWLAWNHRVRLPLMGKDPIHHRQVLGHMAVSMKDHPEFLFLLLREYPPLYLL